MKTKSASNDVLVIIAGGDNQYPDPARNRREGHKAVLNAFEIKQIKCTKSRIFSSRRDDIK